jgi:hypothetical protein
LPGPDSDVHLAAAVTTAAVALRPAKTLLERFIAAELPPEVVVRVGVKAAVADAARLLAAGGGYLVVADDAFAPETPGAALLNTGEWLGVELFTGAWRSAWERGRDLPDRLPRHFATMAVARAAVPAFPGYELRCARLQPVGAETIRVR